MKDIKTEIIDTTKQVGDLVGWLILRHSPPELYEPTIYIDLEGVNLCCEGSLSILTLLIDTDILTMRVCLIDVYSLGSKAFNTIGINGKTLRELDCPQISHGFYSQHLDHTMNPRLLVSNIFNCRYYCKRLGLLEYDAARLSALILVESTDGLEGVFATSCCALGTRRSWNISIRDRFKRSHFD